MKKVFAIILIVLFLLIVLCACGGWVETGREAVDWRYTAPYDGVETDYVYKYDIFKGEFVLVPEIKSVHHDAVYEIRYCITYENGSTIYEWKTVTAAEYEEVTQ